MWVVYDVADVLSLVLLQLQLEDEAYAFQRLLSWVVGRGCPFANEYDVLWLFPLFYYTPQALPFSLGEVLQ